MRQLIAVTMAVLAMPVHAEERIIPGKLVIDPPTLICLGFHLPITGDAKENAVATIRFRTADGPGPWREGLPLWRTNGEVSGDDFTPPVSRAANAFTGSLFDLEAGTRYEVEIRLEDPDGVVGEAVHRATVTTRPEPRAATDGRLIRVPALPMRRETLLPALRLREQAPPVLGEGAPVRHVFSFGTPREKKAGIPSSYRGLLHALYGYTFYCDWAFDPDRVKPGTVILVHAGMYSSNRRNYREVAGNSLWFHGTYVLSTSGTAEAPIVIRAAGDGPVIFDGQGCDTLFEVTAADHVRFEGITFRNARVAMKAGERGVAGCTGLQVVDCHFEDIALPLMTTHARNTDFWLAGNTVDGKASPLVAADQVQAIRTLLIDPDQVRPGDIYELEVGTYHLRQETDVVGGPWQGGTLVMTRGGTAERPVVIRAAPGAEVILDGGGCDTLLDVRAADHVHLEGLVLRNAKIAIKAGMQFQHGSTGLVVSRCRIEEVGYGILATSGACRDILISDTHMRSWKVSRVGEGQVYDRDHGYGINLLGTGHVVRFNNIADFWDNLDICTNGHDDPAFGRPAISVDFYNNVLGRAGDSAGEADGAVRNVRILRNRGGFTCQPIRGGPVYFIRNHGGPGKFMQNPSGVVAYHNRTGEISTWRGAGSTGRHAFVNNLVGGGLLWDSLLSPAALDGNAYLSSRTQSVQLKMKTAELDLTLSDLASFQEKTGFERHGLVLEREDPALLRDRAVRLPNVNDDFVGDGPDIGPQEQGHPVPHYGPRPLPIEVPR